MNLVWNKKEVEQLIQFYLNELTKDLSSNQFNILSLDLEYLSYVYKQLGGNVDIIPQTEQFQIEERNRIKSNYYSIVRNTSLNQILLKDSKLKQKHIHLKEKSIIVSTGISLIDSFLDKEQSSYFKLLIKNNKIQLDQEQCTVSYAYGFTSHLLLNNDSYIYNQYRNDLMSNVVLTHEFGHAFLYKGCPKEAGCSMNYYTSYLRETYSLLMQLLFIDSLENKFNKKEIINLKYKMVNYYIGYCDFEFSRNHLEFPYSNLLAFYFYKLYYEDKDKYERLINKLKVISFTLSDSDILNALNISESDLKDVSNYYINSIKTKDKYLNKKKI